MTVDAEKLPEVMTTKQVLQYLRISEKVLRNLRRDGLISPLPGNPLFAKEWCLYYQREDVVRLKREGRPTRTRATAA